MAKIQIPAAAAEAAVTSAADDPRPVVFSEPSNRKVLLTPELAMEFLARSDLNRLLSRDRASGLAEAFKRGEHRLTGDAIVFNRYGFMTNGQHRCLAVVMSRIDTGLEFWVMEGADDDEQMVQDTGRPRSFADHLRVKGAASASTVSGVTKLLWNYENGVMTDINRWRSRLTPTVFQLDSYISTREPAIREGMKHADRVRHKLPLTTSVLAVAWVIISAIDREDAEGFWDEISMRTPPGDAVNLLASQVLRNSRKTKGKQATGWYNTFDSRHQLALVIKTWNNYRSGNVPQNLVFRTAGVSPEAFPEPR